MAQYYQIVGGPSLTIEDIQRYCPNICVDGVVGNDENRYAQQSVVVQNADTHNDIILSEGGHSKVMVGDNIQYRQPYIIRHEPPQQMSTSQQPQAPATPQPEFRQQQPRPQIQQHSVYYASQADKQVVLEEAQKIIDASLLQQQEQQRQQHMVTPNHVVPQPTVIHPAQQPPPQPPPLRQLPHTSQTSQQLISRVSQSPHLIQQLQQQHQIQIQQQLHQHLQSQQQQRQSVQQHQPVQHKQVQQHQPVQQQHQQVQHKQVQQHQPVQQQHQQVQQQPHQQVQQQQHQQAMTYPVGSPTRPSPSRIVNQSLNTPGVASLVRSQGKIVRPRTRPVKPPALRHLTPPVQGSPGLVHSIKNPRAPSPRMSTPQGPRLARPRTPSQQQQQPQQMQQLLQSQQHPSQHQQLTHTQLQQQTQHHTQQQMQQQQLPQQILTQRLHSPQIEHLKLAQHQRLLNQQHNQAQARRVGSPIQMPSQPTRIITPQGIIVQQAPNHQQQPSQGSSQLPQQNSQVILSQRTSPALPSRKVVQQNDANEMDDLEDSITAAVLQKNPPEAKQLLNTSQPLAQANAAQYGYGQQQHQYGQQLQVYDPPQHQYMMDDAHDDDGQLLTLPNGQRLTLAEYKRLHLSPRLQQGQQMSGNGQQQIVHRKDSQRPVQRVMPMQSQQQIHASSAENNESTLVITELNPEPQSAKMLIFLQNGEQRLITFTLPKESCTVQEVLEQVNVPYSDDVQCLHHKGGEVDYVVTIGGRTRMDEIETHPIFNGDINSNSPSRIVNSQPTSEQTTPEKLMEPISEGSPEAARSPPPKYIDGKVALCKFCGYTGYDFSRCQRCRRIFTEEPKTITLVSQKEDKKKDGEKSHNSNLIEKSIPITGEIKLNLLKTVKTAKNNMAEKKVVKARKGRKQPDPEPVILTLSSDEEDSNSSFAAQTEQSVSSKEPSLSEIEDGTPDSGIGYDHDDDSSSPPGTPALMTSLQCRTIRIGSLRYSPKEKVFLSPKGIKIVAPCVKDGSKEVALQIHIREIVRLLTHYGKGMPVIFIYTMSICGNYIRKELDMSEDGGPYYNPVSKHDAVKRITLLPDFITDETKLILKKLFGQIMDELSCREANDILVKSSTPETSPSAKSLTKSLMPPGVSGVKSTSSTEIRQILIYPPGKGGISINTEDFMCLAQDQFLNDVIIDFYLKHLFHDVLTDSQREKTHIFSTFFYKRLTTKPSKVNKISNPHEWDSTLTPAQKRHTRVKTWTKNVNIFEKDFVIVPINENCHWFVAIICFPSLEGCRSMLDNRIVTPKEVKRKDRSSLQIGNTTITQIAKQEQIALNFDSDSLSERDEAEAEDSDLDMQCDSDEEEIAKLVEEKVEVVPSNCNEPIKQPCILICDSLAGASRSRVVATLRDYLTCEYNAKISTNKKYTKDNIKGVCPKVPQQNNFTDCGLYLLQYVESFFLDPILDYTLPIKQLVNWFDEIVVTRKREEISNLIKSFICKYNPDSSISLPHIHFPTQNGKLVETEEQEFDSDEDKCSSDGTITPTRLTLIKQPSGDIVLKRSIADSGDSVHVRKSIRLANCTDSENRKILILKN